MHNTALFLTIIGMGLVTFGIRLSFIVFSDRIKLPDIVRRGLKYVPVAVLSAIIFPDVFMPQGHVDFSINNAYLFAGLFAAVIAWTTKNVVLTMVVGLAVLWGWQLVF